MSEAETIDTYLEDGALTASAWGTALREGVLLGQSCGDCGHVTAAPKAACVQCGSRELTVERLPTEGEVYTETTIGVPPADFEGPYTVAIVTLGDAHILARVDDEAAIGDRVALDGVVEIDEPPAPLFR